jgi:hypothetical protein
MVDLNSANRGLLKNEREVAIFRLLFNGLHFPARRLTPAGVLYAVDGSGSRASWGLDSAGGAPHSIRSRPWMNAFSAPIW